MATDAANWRSAVDERSGRTYWYHKYTRESTWTEPECLKMPVTDKPPAFPPMQASSSVTTTAGHSNVRNNSVPVQTTNSGVVKLFEMIDGLTSLDEVVSLLLSSSEHSQIEGCQLILETLTHETIDEWGSHPSLLSSLCLVCSRPLSTTSRAIALKTMWAMSLFSRAPSTADSKSSNNCIFHNSSEWLKLGENIRALSIDSMSQRSWDMECAFYYVYMVALLSVGPVQDAVNKTIAPVVLQFLMSICDSSRSLNFDNIISYKTIDGIGAISNSSLRVLCSYAKQGSLIAGYTFAWISLTSFRSDATAGEFLKSGGLPLLQRLCSDGVTAVSGLDNLQQALQKKLKEVILLAMSASDFVRNRVLESYLDMVASLDDVAIPTLEHNPLNVGYRSPVSSHASAGLFPSRDVVLKPRASSAAGCGWKLNSSILWMRCHGLRSVLEDFWHQNDWSESSSGGFELELDASEEVLAALVYFIQSGMLLAPVALVDRLELLKLAYEVEMQFLYSQVLSCVHQMLIADDLNQVSNFARQFGFRDLMDIADDFRRTGSYSISHFNINLNPKTTTHDSRRPLSSNEMDLRSAIAASISDVSAILAEPDKPINRQQQQQQNQQQRPQQQQPQQQQLQQQQLQQQPIGNQLDKYSNQITVPPAQRAVEIGSKMDASRPTSSAPTSAPLPSGAKGVKSGGIYTLLLASQGDEADGHGHSGQVISQRVSENKMPGRVVNGSSKPGQGSKANSSNNKSRRSSTGDNDTSFDSTEDIVEYSNRMSLAPSKKMTEQEKRLIEMSKPRNPIAKKVNTGKKQQIAVEEEEGEEELAEVANSFDAEAHEEATTVQPNSRNANLSKGATTAASSRQSTSQSQQGQQSKQAPTRSESPVMNQSKTQSSSQNQSQNQRLQRPAQAQQPPPQTVQPEQVAKQSAPQRPPSSRQAANTQPPQSGNLPRQAQDYADATISSSGSAPGATAGPALDKAIDPVARGSLQLLKNRVKTASRRRSTGAEYDAGESEAQETLPSAAQGSMNNKWISEPTQQRQQQQQHQVPPGRSQPQQYGRSYDANEDEYDQQDNHVAVRVPINLESSVRNGTQSKAPTVAPAAAYTNRGYSQPTASDSLYQGADEEDEGDYEENNDYSNAADESADIDNADLVECPDCSRKFLPGPFEKHAKICAKVFMQKRKKFDSTKMRIKDFEELNDPSTRRKLSKKASVAPAAHTAAAASGGAQSTWKDKSNAFREAMRAAREVSKAIAEGAPLPPPVISAPDPSLIPCPHCGRRFNDRAAERHIPQCQSIKAKPTNLKRGSGIQASSTTIRKPANNAKKF